MHEQAWAVSCMCEHRWVRVWEYVSSFLFINLCIYVCMRIICGHICAHVTEYINNVRIYAHTCMSMTVYMTKYESTCTYDQVWVSRPMCKDIHVYIWLGMCQWICLCDLLCVCEYAYVIRMCVCMWSAMYMGSYICNQPCVYMFICPYIQLGMCLYMQLDINVYQQTYVYVHIYEYTWLGMCANVVRMVVWM